jgi:intracellular sulfur oxidation DsrE/DsrF family protein
MTRINFLLMLLAVAGSLAAQSLDERLKAVEKDMIYPVMKSHPHMGVLPVTDPALGFSAKQKHKIAIDLTMPFSDSSKVSTGITEIGRTFNLHVANGAPKENIDMVVIIHGPAVRSFFTDEVYAKRNGIPNPNLAAIQELSRNGVKFYICGQSLGILKMSKASFTPVLQATISAKTAVTDFQSRGYSLLYMSAD